MSKYTFRIITLFGYLIIVLGLILPAWQLDVKMGEFKPNITARIFESFDLSKLSGNFSNFDTTMLPSIRSVVIALISASTIGEILLFASTALKPEHRKAINVIIVMLAVITLLSAIALFVLNIIFVKQNNLTQTNGFTLKPILKNGIYLMLMGGFANGLFSIYAIEYQK